MGSALPDATFWASSISATSLKVLAAVNRAPPSSDQLRGCDPPSSTRLIPTVAPLAFTSCWTAAARVAASRVGSDAIGATLVEAPVEVSEVVETGWAWAFA